jgi:hypothetical protein
MATLATLKPRHPRWSPVTMARVQLRAGADRRGFVTVILKVVCPSLNLQQVDGNRPGAALRESAE